MTVLPGFTRSPLPGFWLMTNDLSVSVTERTLTSSPRRLSSSRADPTVRPSIDGIRTAFDTLNVTLVPALMLVPAFGLVAIASPGGDVAVEVRGDVLHDDAHRLE